jgi:uncharacterized cofD-like protein
LRGLKEFTSNLTAVVTVVDDGTSTIQREFGALPPRDFRNCIVAMSDEEPLMSKLFQYRFGEGSGLDGYNFGNLFIVALSNVTGSFERALEKVGRVLAVRGRILPSTLSYVRLLPEGPDELRLVDAAEDTPSELTGRVRIEPSDAVAYPEAIKDILEADLIVLGPGSLYKSVLPSLLVPGIREAIRASRAVKTFVCNVATQQGETEGFDVTEHVRVIKDHAGDGIFDYVMANDNLTAEVPSAEWPTELVQVVPGKLAGLRVVEMDLVDRTNPRRHDPAKVAEALLKLYYDRAPRRVFLPASNEVRRSA